MRPGCVVRIDVHGSKDRAKDASSDSFVRSLVRMRSAYALWRMLTAFPSSASFGHPLSPARLLAEGDTSARIRTDQDPLSNDDPRRSPPFRRSGCLSPSRHTKESLIARRGFHLSGLRTGSLAHAAHTLFLLAKESCMFEHCKCHGAVTRSIRDCSRVQTPL